MKYRGFWAGASVLVSLALGAVVLSFLLDRPHPSDTPSPVKLPDQKLAEKPRPPVPAKPMKDAVRALRLPPPPAPPVKVVKVAAAPVPPPPPPEVRARPKPKPKPQPKPKPRRRPGNHYETNQYMDLYVEMAKAFGVE